MFQVKQDPSIKLFGSDIQIHIPITQDSQIHSLMNGVEESTNADIGVPLDDVSSKQSNPQENTDVIANMYKTSTSKAATKAVHRTNEQKSVRRVIDNQEKIFKKPDKVLPCPRCNSFETKFCYFNNYNVNQPRHFCKKCQRYWTAGGAIRNVPIGAGKRRNKQLDSQNSKEEVQVPLSESLETVLNLKDHTKIEMESSTVKEDIDDPSSSSMRAAESGENEYSENGIDHVGLNMTPQYNGLIPLHSLHYYSAPPWTCQWNPCYNAMDSATMMTPSSYWSCMPNWVGQMEDFSLVAINGIPSPSSSVNSGTCSGNKSPTLGKHCRDRTTFTEDSTKPNIWVPKTIRINDPEEAAKSSIWSTLITKSQQNKPIMKGSVFKSFEPKLNASSHDLDDNQILRANPAAFSRSGSFQESM